MEGVLQEKRFLQLRKNFRSLANARMIDQIFKENLQCMLTDSEFTAKVEVRKN